MKRWKTESNEKMQERGEKDAGEKRRSAAKKQKKYTLLGAI